MKHRTVTREEIARNGGRLDAQHYLETPPEPRIEHVRTWSWDDFRLDVWDTHRRDKDGKAILRYALFDGGWNGGRLIFDDDDFHCSPLHAIDSDDTMLAILNFLALSDGDTDASYFERYTQNQLRWRDARAQDLHLAAFECFIE